MLTAALLAGATAKTPPAPLPADRAVAALDASRKGVVGRFEMTVAATGMAKGDLYLNSEADYRAPDDLSFELAPNVVAALAKRYGAPPAEYLRGRHVIVDGTLARRLIVNTINGNSVSANRWQHTVRVQFAHQIVSVE